MSLHKSLPPRQRSANEQQEVTHIGRSRVTPAAEVIRATIHWDVARCYDYQTAASSVA